MTKDNNVIRDFEGSFLRKNGIRDTYKMSTRDARSLPIRYTRNSRRRKVVLDVDLNVVPPSENGDREGTSTPAEYGQVDQQGGSMSQVQIDLEAIDDDVILSSPTAFEEAKNNPRRNNRRTVVVDDGSEDRSSRFGPNIRNKRRRENQSVIDCDLYINLEGSSNPKKEDVHTVAPPPLPVKPPTFSCPVCMGPLVEEMSTKCGHIFCKVCIKTAIAAQSKCPTCRRKLTMKDTFRVYLPAAV